MENDNEVGSEVEYDGKRSFHWINNFEEWNNKIGFLQEENKKMMRYSEWVSMSKSVSLAMDGVLAVDSDIRVTWHLFKSKSRLVEREEKEDEIAQVLGVRDEDYLGNAEFNFPVVWPSEKKAYNRVILLLHGLNERSWDKYWSWAMTLSEGLKAPVLLFPISFHMNRGPAGWGNPREMTSWMATSGERKSTDLTSSLNFALSQRLLQRPLRFFESGRQTAFDLSQLVEQIELGQFEGLSKGTKIDVFAYSIGAFLAQIMMIGGKGKFLPDARYFLFCGGSLFTDMNGVSKFIMNRPAFEHIYAYYNRQMEYEMVHQTPLGAFFLHDELGRAFNAMINWHRNPRLLEAVFQDGAKRIRAIGLKRDHVIPSKAIFSNLVRRKSLHPSFTELDFPFPYSHENPFPVTNEHKEDVDIAFKSIFDDAISWLK